MNKSLALIVVLCFSCSVNSPETVSSTFTKPVELGLVDTKLPEVSGIASSVVNPGMMWAVNDSGNTSEVFLIDTTGKVKLTCKLPVDNTDWEEVVVGPGPVKGKTYVYVGEIGDNVGIHQTKTIYRFEEPLADGAEKNITLTDTLQIKLSDGARDTETMLIDPLTSNFYFISKREDSVGVYKLKLPFKHELMTAERVVKVNLSKIVAGAFSPDGTEVILKDYDHIYYWKRKKNERLEQMLLRRPEELPYDVEAQGEALTWKLDGSGYYTLSETNPGKPSHLKFYGRK